MKPGIVLALLWAAAPAAAFAQQAPPAAPAGEVEARLMEFNFHPAITTFDRVEGEIKGAALTITSESWGPDGVIPVKFSGPPPNGQSVSPQLSWTKGPPGAKSYVLFFEDNTNNRNRLATMHWLAFNIPADVTSLPEGISVKGLGIKTPVGTMKEGANVDNTTSYTGMGGGPTGANYRLQIFALDKLLDLPSGAVREQVWDAMMGHVIASGQYWTYYRPALAPNTPAPGTPQAGALAVTQFANAQRSFYLPSSLTIHRPPGQIKGAALSVDAPGFSRFGTTGFIMPKFTAGGGNARGYSISPELTWSKGPATTRSYVVMVEDNYEHLNRDPTLYWLAYDIPAATTRLAEGVAAKGGAFKQGLNKDGQATYVGMTPPPNMPALNYHFEVFALDKVLGLPAGASRDQIRAAMKGHVVARGQTLGFYQAPGAAQAYLPPPVPRN